MISRFLNRFTKKEKHKKEYKKKKLDYKFTKAEKEHIETLNREGKRGERIRYVRSLKEKYDK